MLIGSADLMHRNLDRRVEVAFPVLAPALRQLQAATPAFLRQTPFFSGPPLGVGMLAAGFVLAVMITLVTGCSGGVVAPPAPSVGQWVDYGGNEPGINQGPPMSFAFPKAGNVAGYFYTLPPGALAFLLRRVLRTPQSA